MKLEISEREAGEILLAWANKKIGMPESGQFNHVDIECSYSQIKSITFSKRKEGEEE